MKQEQQALIQLPAGQDSEGQRVLEKLDVYVMEEAGHYELEKSPLLVRGLAKGDIIYIDPQQADKFIVVKHSGNLAVRVFRKADIEVLENSLTPQIEMSDGTLDIKTDRGLSYSLHVNLGFATVEALFDNAMAAYPDSVWYYGNVYDSADGITPLNWWDSFINQV
ncbi:MAG: phosphotyrosine protein phosphatase [SAR86 cluster bacterium]|uniref:Phosphotyrosine protein phosphatase n=1 Tax=SAR86 cluster bacterium TaxID=2030880 RepID=A0A2A5CI76_9GAMM|nr:MAG: phosphotyrosine protein phosphatase [SAR86 cluster bacterium]